MAGGVGSGGSDGLKRLPKGYQKRRILWKLEENHPEARKSYKIASKRSRNRIDKCLEGSPKVAKSTKSANNHQKAAKSNKIVILEASDRLFGRLGAFKIIKIIASKVAKS